MSTRGHVAVGQSPTAPARPKVPTATGATRTPPTAVREPARWRVGGITVTAAGVATVLVGLMTVLYSGYFVYASYMRYRHFLPHAEDLGNMEQAVWNTAHGNPFGFNNLRFQSFLEASGTTTRLSFHVEPIFFLLALVYKLRPTPANLLVVQTVVVASGAFPAAWLARRYLHSALAQVAFPLAYLLAPPLEAANLYEFHPVTLSAGLLLWAFYFADGRRYVLFAVFGLLAMATKEEIGLIVGLMGLWIWWRHRDRTIGLSTTVLAVGWSLFAVLVIMRHFHNGPSSPYCGRFNPYTMNGQNLGNDEKVTSCLGVAQLWLHHPDQVLSIVWITQKMGFLHRMLVTTGYLSLLSPLTLLISLPSYAIILFSNDIHMYSGLGHYPAELVPILIGSAIIGTAWLSRTVSRASAWLSRRAARLPRLRVPVVPPGAIVTVACLWLLVMSVANTTVNGFTPLSAAAASMLQPLTNHDRAAQQLINMIPPGASVTAGDYLNAHLSDRPGIFLFDDHKNADYIAVDVSRDWLPFKPSDEQGHIMALLDDPKHEWGVKYAVDGLLLLERRKLDPSLPTTLPASFYSFVVSPTPPVIQHPLRVNYGPSLQLVGYSLDRSEQVNLRLPDVVLTTYWRLSAPVTGPITPVIYMSNPQGALDVQGTDEPATDWLPANKWPVGRIITLQAVPLGVFANDNGKVDLDLAVYQPAACTIQADAYAATNKVDAAHPIPTCDLIDDAGAGQPEWRYRPDVRWTPGLTPLEVVDRATILKLTQIPVQW